MSRTDLRANELLLATLCLEFCFRFFEDCLKDKHELSVGDLYTICGVERSAASVSRREINTVA